MVQLRRFGTVTNCFATALRYLTARQATGGPRAFGRLIFGFAAPKFRFVSPVHLVCSKRSMCSSCSSSSLSRPRPLYTLPRPRLSSLIRFGASVPLVLVIVGLAGCEHSTRLVEPGAEEDTTSGTVQRAVLELTVSLNPEDSALASVIGLEGGVLPDAEVTIRRKQTAGSERTGVSDANGVVRFEDLIPGEYTGSALRLLTPEEIEVLVKEANEDITAFAGSADIPVTAPTTGAELPAGPDREPTSLLISEVSITLPRLPSGEFYPFAHYAEVYNNTDTTIFLDGKVFVLGFRFGTRDANETFNCESMRPWREEPDGIWTVRVVEQFPGAGADFPLEPGETAVLATDAIDHSTVDPILPDLSGADFEFIGSSDADNPAVPNMVSVGTEIGFGRGLSFSFNHEVVVIAEPVDPTELRKEDVPGVQGDPEHWLIPASKLLDVASLGPTPANERGIVEDLGGEFCEQFTHEKFARGWAPVLDPSDVDGHHRPVIAVRDGRKILQRTRVSELDFFTGPMSPGLISE